MVVLEVNLRFKQDVCYISQLPFGFASVASVLPSAMAAGLEPALLSSVVAVALSLVPAKSPCRIFLPWK